MSIEIYNESVEKTMQRVKGARLVIADPPWSYNNNGQTMEGSATGHFHCVSSAEILEWIDSAYGCAIDDAYLFLWITWPLLVSDYWGVKWGRWEMLSGGTWAKLGGFGMGFHMRGDCEPFLLLRKGKPHPNQKNLSNLFLEPREEHSAKPVKITRRVIEALTAPGELCFSMFVGLGNDAVAAKQAGRRFVGAELDPSRYAIAKERIGESVPGLQVQASLF